MKFAIFRGCALSVVMFLISACGQNEISFKAEVQPILKQYCLECHSVGGTGYDKSGLLMSNYESLMKGTRFGAIIKPGDSLTSVLIMLVEGRADPSIKMPHGRAPLTKEKISVLRTWVEQGARNN